MDNWLILFIKSSSASMKEFTFVGLIFSVLILVHCDVLVSLFLSQIKMMPSEIRLIILPRIVVTNLFFCEICSVCSCIVSSICTHDQSLIFSSFCWKITPLTNLFLIIAWCLCQVSIWFVSSKFPSTIKIFSFESVIRNKISLW